MFIEVQEKNKKTKTLVNIFNISKVDAEISGSTIYLTNGDKLTVTSNVKEVNDIILKTLSTTSKTCFGDLLSGKLSLF